MARCLRRAGSRTWPVTPPTMPGDRRRRAATMPGDRRRRAEGTATAAMTRRKDDRPVSSPVIHDPADRIMRRNGAGPVHKPARGSGRWRERHRRWTRNPDAPAPRHQARHQARHRGPASGARHQARRRGPASGARHQARHRDPASGPAPGPGTPDAAPSRARALDGPGLQPAATGAGFRDAPQIALAQKARPVCGPPAGASATAGQHPDPPRHASPCPAPPRVRRRRRIATPGWQPWRSGCESQGCQRLA